MIKGFLEELFGSYFNAVKKTKLVYLGEPSKKCHKKWKKAKKGVMGQGRNYKSPQLKTWSGGGGGG